MISKIIDQLETSELIPVKKAEQIDLNKSGLYAIYIDTPDSLPASFGNILRQRGSKLLYVGRARDSLAKRLVNQELRHKGQGTFFAVSAPYSDSNLLRDPW